jgi:thioredoxin reductase (NADPH)
MSVRIPVLLAVDEDQEALERTEGELIRRYGGDYRVVCETSPRRASEELARMAKGGDQVVLVLAAPWMAETPGSDFMVEVRRLHPHAKRALLIDWGAWSHRPTADAILRAMALGRIDYYVVKPRRARDEGFHLIDSEFLHEWSREHSPDAHEIVVMADPSSPRGLLIREGLRRNGVPHGFEATASDPPKLRLRDGRLLVDPTDEEIATVVGVGTAPSDNRDQDVIIIGAGPAGLSAAVSASSEGMRTLVIERVTVGGQASSSSLIRNYLGFSRGVSGGELSGRAYQQAWVFGAQFAITRKVISLTASEELRTVTCDSGYTAAARAVVIATGVSYRRIGIPELEELTGAGVYYGASALEGRAIAGGQVYVVGGGNSAGQTALYLARSADRVSLLVRGSSLADMSRYLRDTIEATPNLDVSLETEVVGGGGDGRLEWLELRDRSSGETRRARAVSLHILIGARPLTHWLPEAIALDEAGYLLTGTDVFEAAAGRRQWPLQRPPMRFETSLPGVFAVGDVRRGALKRVASAVGEGSVAIRDVYDYLAQGPAGLDSNQSITRGDRGGDQLSGR